MWRWLMHPEFQSTNFNEYQVCVCTDMGTQDITLSLPLKGSNQWERQHLEQITIQHTYSDWSVKTKCDNNIEWASNLRNPEKLLKEYYKLAPKRWVDSLGKREKEMLIQRRENEPEIS